MSNRERIIDLFHAVKQKGFVTSHRRNNTGIGKTFEDLIGVEENNIDAPDLLGYEIKSHREKAESYVTLFTKAPSFPLHANQQLLEQFGETKNGRKRLHTSTGQPHQNRTIVRYIRTKELLRIVLISSRLVHSPTGK